MINRNWKGRNEIEIRMSQDRDKSNETVSQQQTTIWMYD